LEQSCQRLVGGFSEASQRLLRGFSEALASNQQVKWAILDSNQ